MNIICKNGTKKTNPELVRPISGLIDELNEMQNKRKEKTIKRRAQSATISRNRVSVAHSPNLYKSRENDRSFRNLRQKSSKEDHLSRSKQIIKTINDCLEEENKINKRTKSKMNYMK